MANDDLTPPMEQGVPGRHDPPTEAEQAWPRLYRQPVFALVSVPPEHAQFIGWLASEAFVSGAIPIVLPAGLSPQQCMALGRLVGEAGGEWWAVERGIPAAAGLYDEAQAAAYSEWCEAVIRFDRWRESHYEDLGIKQPREVQSIVARRRSGPWGHWTKAPK